MLRSPACRLLIGRDGEEIIGMLTLVLFRIPTAVRAWIEDVVVDEGARSQGVGRALSSVAIRIAQENGGRQLT